MTDKKRVKLEDIKLNPRRKIKISKNYIKSYDYTTVWECDICTNQSWYLYSDKARCIECGNIETFRTLKLLWAKV